MALISTAETTATGVSIWENGPTIISEESVWKRPVRAASVGNVDLGSVPLTLDGVTLADGDRLGIFFQSLPEQNGIYERINSTTWQRASDFETGALVEAGIKVYTKEGAVNAKQTFRLSAPATGTITVGITPTTWENDPGSATTGWSSVTIDELSTATVAKINVFDQANYGGTLDYTDNVTPQNVTFTPADGRFTFDVAGVFLVSVDLILLSGGAPTLANVSYDLDGVEIYTTQIAAHSSVDPTERTIAIIVGVSAGSYIECFIDATAATTIQITPGTTCNILAAGGSLDAAVDLQAAYDNGNAITTSAVEGGPVAITTTADETNGALTLTAGNHTAPTAEVLLALAMDDNSDAGAIQITNPSTQAGGSALVVSPAAAGAVAPQIDLAWPSAAYTGTPGSVRIDYSALAAADLDGISASFDAMLIDLSQAGGARNLPFPIYGLRLKGRPSNSASDQIALYIESALGVWPLTSWDWGIITESPTKHKTGVLAAFGDSNEFTLLFTVSGTKPVPGLYLDPGTSPAATVRGYDIRATAQDGGVASGATNAGLGGGIELTAGGGGAASTGTGTARQGGGFTARAGAGGDGDATTPVGGGSGGSILLVSGDGGTGAGAAAGGDAGDVNIFAGAGGNAAAGAAGNGGDVNVRGGTTNGASAADFAGSVFIDSGLATGSATPGSIGIGTVSAANAISIGTNSTQTLTLGDGTSSVILLDGGGTITLDSNAVLSVPVATLRNNIGNVGLYHSNASPDGVVNAQAGSVCLVDTGADGQVWVNDSAVSGISWEKLTSTNAWVSETMTGTFTPVGAPTTADVFASSSWSVYTQITNAAGNNITYTPADGRFTVSKAGTYEINVPLFLSSSATTVVNLYVHVNGVQVWTAQPFVHSTVDPVERSISLIKTLAAGDYVNIVLLSGSANTITVIPGTTMNMKRIG